MAVESAQALETNRRLEHEMGRLAANRDEVCRDKLELETGDQIITRSSWSSCGGSTRSLQPDTGNSALSTSRPWSGAGCTTRSSR